MLGVNQTHKPLEICLSLSQTQLSRITENMVTRCLSAGARSGGTVFHQHSGGCLVPIATLPCLCAMPSLSLFSTLPFWNYQTLRSQFGPQLSLTPVWDCGYIPRDTQALSGELWAEVGLEMTFLISPEHLR